MRLLSVVVLAFGVAMGYLEATVVVYLRAAIESTTIGGVPDPNAFNAFQNMEVVRELATLVMIGAVAWLAGRSFWERLAWAAVVFGAWDLTYYAGLRAITGWPPAFDSWDVLFLVPSPWVGPVWAPMLTSAALIGFGLAGARWARSGRAAELGRLVPLGAVTGGCLVVLSFLVDTTRVLDSDAAAWTGWPIYWTGMALAAVATTMALSGRRSAPPAGSAGGPRA